MGWIVDIRCEMVLYMNIVSCSRYTFSWFNWISYICTCLTTTFNLKEVPAAFVSFKSRFGAAIALNIQESINPTHWITEQAPEPQDVYWPFFSVTFIRRWISKLVAYVACNVLTILFLIPVALVQGLSHLDQLETMFPALKCILRM